MFDYFLVLPVGLVDLGRRYNLALPVRLLSVGLRVCGRAHYDTIS